MSQQPCSHIEAVIQQITQDLQAIDDQLHALEVEGMNLLHPWAYVVLQQQGDRLAKKKRALQDAWDRAMTDLDLQVPTLTTEPSLVPIASERGTLDRSLTADGTTAASRTGMTQQHTITAFEQLVSA